jgi:hypothetical protein
MSILLCNGIYNNQVIHAGVSVFADDRLLSLISLFASIPFPSDDEPRPLLVRIATLETAQKYMNRKIINCSC